MKINDSWKKKLWKICIWWKCWRKGAAGSSRILNFEQGEFYQGHSKVGGKFPPQIMHFDNSIFHWFFQFSNNDNRKITVGAFS